MRFNWSLLLAFTILGTSPTFAVEVCVLQSKHVDAVKELHTEKLVKHVEGPLAVLLRSQGENLRIVDITGKPPWCKSASCTLTLAVTEWPDVIPTQLESVHQVITRLDPSSKRVASIGRTFKESSYKIYKEPIEEGRIALTEKQKDIFLTEDESALFQLYEFWASPPASDFFYRYGRILEVINPNVPMPAPSNPTEQRQSYSTDLRRALFFLNNALDPK